MISLQHQDTPVSIGLLVDNSGSMNTKRAAVAAAALDLVKASNPQDESFVINFSDRPISTRTSPRISINYRMGSRISVCRGHCTLRYSRDRRRQDGAICDAPQKGADLITDGDDNASKLTLDNAVHRVQDMQGPIIYSIGLLFGGDKSRHAKRDLQALSSETGGIAFFPNTLKDVDSVAARDIRNQYTIAYHSPQAPIGGYHTVKVEAHASGHGKLTVYTRSGYRSKQPSSGIAQKP